MTHPLSSALATALAAIAGGSVAGEGGQVHYEIHELPAIGAFTEVARPRGVDALGRVAGDSLDDAMNPRAIRWDDQLPVLLETSPTTTSGGWGNSPNGLVAGWVDDGRTWAAVWTLDGTMTLFDPFPGDEESWAADVNDTGMVAGWTINITGLTRATVWANGKTQLIGDLDSAAIAINEAGAVVFRQGSAAFAWTEEFTAQLPDLGMDQAVPTGIGEDGTMIGGALHRDQRTHAVLWLPDTYAIVDLGTYEGQSTIASGINDSGTIVGDYWIDQQGTIRRALVWLDGDAHELEDLLPPGHGWTLERARAINEAGMIVGSGTLDGVSGERGFILLPIAQPGDLDGNGAVDVADLVLLIAAWGACSGPCPADLDGDGSVGTADLVVLVLNWS